MSTSEIESANNATPQSSEKKHVLLPVFVVFLLAIAALQGWYLYDMKTQLDSMQTAETQPIKSNANMSVATVSPSTTATPTQAATSQQPLTPSAPVTQIPAIPPTAGSNQGVQPYSYRDPFNDPFFQRGFGNTGNWDPYADIQRMQQEMDAIMRGAFQHSNQYYGMNGHPSNGSVSNQPGDNVLSMDMVSGDLDVEEKGNDYVVTLPVKEADKNNLNVNIDENRLTVSGQQIQKNEQTDESGNTVFQGQMNASFSRSITLPGPVKPDSMRTEIHNNVLEITVEKAA